MFVRSHLKIFIVVTAAWFLFWIAGLPDCYRQYSTRFMITFDAAVLSPLVLVVYSVVKKTRRGGALPLSLWLAFYMTVPLFLYDLMYCGYYLGHGFSFVREYWYLTVYYVLPWVVFPISGLLVERQRKAVSA
jgi:hypothetical protein